MRIVFITNSIGFGGAEKMITFVANGMANRGHDVALINFGATDSLLNEQQQFIEDSISLYSYKTQSKGRVARFQKILFSIKSVRAFKADVMVCFTTFPNYVGKIVSLYTGIPSIMSERGNPYVTINKNNIPSLIELFFVNRSSGGVFQIQGAADFYSKRLQKRSVIIPNPIFIKNKVNPIEHSQREKAIVSVGRLENEQKRYDVMIKAFAQFSQNHPDWVLKLYGNGKDKEIIKQWCIDSGVIDRVRFMGVSRNPMSDINDASMFLITSDYEGISNALLEAMAIGLPCISTDSAPGGARMLIEHMHNGLLVPVGKPDTIADAMELYADKPQLAIKCGENAKKVINRFDQNFILDKWECYIMKVCKQKDY